MTTQQTATSASDIDNFAGNAESYLLILVYCNKLLQRITPCKRGKQQRGVPTANGATKNRRDRAPDRSGHIEQKGSTARLFNTLQI